MPNTAVDLSFTHEIFSHLIIGSCPDDFNTETLNVEPYNIIVFVCVNNKFRGRRSFLRRAQKTGSRFIRWIANICYKQIRMTAVAFGAQSWFGGCETRRSGTLR